MPSFTESLWGTIWGVATAAAFLLMLAMITRGRPILKPFSDGYEMGMLIVGGFIGFLLTLYPEVPEHLMKIFG